MTPVPVSIAGDVTWGPSLHAWYPPDVFDMSAPMDWPVGATLKQHALAGTVRHRGQALVLEGHDLGLLLPHKGEDVLARISSSRKPIWSASTVKACGKPVACLGGPKLLTMMLCGAPFKFAAGVNDSNHHYNVFVGLSDLDYFKGWVSVGAEFVKDAFALGLAKGSDAAGAVFGGFGGKDFEGALLDAGIDLVASGVVSAYSGWEEPIGTKVTIGLPYWNESVELKWKVDGPSGAGSVITNPVGSLPAPGVELIEVNAQRRTPFEQHEARWSKESGWDASSKWETL